MCWRKRKLQKDDIESGLPEKRITLKPLYRLWGFFLFWNGLQRNNRNRKIKFILFTLKR